MSTFDYQTNLELKRIADSFEQLLTEVENHNRTFEQLLNEVKQIRVAVVGRPTKLQLQFQGGLPGMPGQETDTQTIPCSAIETDADGQPVTLNPANVTWSIDNPAIAALTQNPDGSATFKALSVGTANVSCSDSSENPPLVGTDTLTVTAGPANKLVLQFGAPA
jgi:hypothetical protein